MTAQKELNLGAKSLTQIATSNIHKQFVKSVFQMMSWAKAHMHILSRQGWLPAVLRRRAHSCAITDVAVKIDKRHASCCSSSVHDVEDG